ncbi:MAG TPA: hypothetical protein VN026_00565 [Bacteroidia bacterium]|jgi:hypothetical protein|nr:hypothetical protein [Bacteroidia bacterium]
MKTKINTVLALIGLFLFLNFSIKDEINKCYIAFTKTPGLTTMEPERLPANTEKFRDLTTETGEVKVSRIDGYRIKYNNNKGVEFVNIKVELSDAKSYGADTTNIIENLKYLNSHSTNMESKDLVVLSFNGYKIYGLGRASLEKGSTLGTFVIFPGNNTTVYFYFNNLKPELRHYEDYSAYRDQRNGFLGNYTHYLKQCKDK